MQLEARQNIQPQRLGFQSQFCYTKLTLDNDWCVAALVRNLSWLYALLVGQSLLWARNALGVWAATSKLQKSSPQASSAKLVKGRCEAITWWMKIIPNNCRIQGFNCVINTTGQQCTITIREYLIGRYLLLLGQWACQILYGQIHMLLLTWSFSSYLDNKTTKFMFSFLLSLSKETIKLHTIMMKYLASLLGRTTGQPNWHSIIRVPSFPICLDNRTTKLKLHHKYNLLL